RKKNGPAVRELQARQEWRNVVRGIQMAYGVQVTLHRGKPALLDGALVNARAVEVPDLLGDGVALRCARRLLQKGPQIIEIVLVELAVNLPGSFVGRNGIIFLPATA